MSIWEPFDPVSYFLHTILGGLGIVGAIVALSVLKGSRKHLLAGRLFVLAAFVAATTAIVFSFTQFAGAALASSTMTYSALGAALLALRPKSRAVLLGEIGTTVLMGLAFAWLVLGAVMGLPQGAWLPPFLYSLFPLALLIGDIRFLRLPPDERRSARLPRHYSHMGFTFAIAVHAPIVSFADELSLHPALAFFGPFIVWPAIVLYFNGVQKRRGIALAKAG